MGRTVRRLAILFVALLSVASCSLSPVSALSSATVIKVHQDYLTLAWDPSASPGRNLPTDIVAYSVFYRRLSDPQWIHLAEVPVNARPQYTVTHDRLGDGFFVFAVSSISADGSVSVLHTSLDWNAIPVSGWYVWWMRNG